MFGINKRIVLALMIGLLASSCGCSILIAQALESTGVDPNTFHNPPRTRPEMREILGEADETRTCPGGQIVEHRWVTQGSMSGKFSIKDEFEDIITIGEWVDSGQVPFEEGLDDIREVTTYKRFWYRY